MTTKSLACALGLGCAAVLRAAEPLAPAPGAAILQDLRSFNTVATVLHIAAHPDDENTALITYLARGRGYRMAYLSLTRGDGGQNEIGPEFDEKLGVARTQELLAARKLDGGRQFFTRAIDFGYSKTVDETLAFWDRKEVLGDVVRIIRQFRPDVVVTRFSPTAGGTHGHHTASAVLAVEACKLSGDANAYPEQLQQGLSVWQPKRVVQNAGGPGRGPGGGGGGDGTMKMDIGGDDPVTGASFGSIAGRSRAMHITQGFGNFGGRGGGGPNEQSFILLGGAAGQGDLMDGIDTTWNRLPGGVEIGTAAAAIIAHFKPDNPAASVPALLELRAKLSKVTADPVVNDKRAQLDRILQACLGLTVETGVAQPEVIPGETLKIRAAAASSSKVPVKWIETRLLYPKMTVRANQDLKAEPTRAPDMVVQVPADAPITQPYWLRQEGKSGIARVDDPRLIGMPENAPTFPVEYVFEVGGQTLVVSSEPLQVNRTAKGERTRRLDVIPPVSLSFASDVSIFAPGTTRSVIVELTAARANVNGTLQLDVTEGWKATAAKPFKLGAVGGKTKLSFDVTAPAKAASGRVLARATIGAGNFTTQRIEINYPHLPLMLLQPPARARLVSLEVATKGRNVGYLPGAGDDTAEALEQLGYLVKTLSGADLTAEKLQGLDAVVIGVRAFNERKDLAANLPGLFAYVEAGGTVIAQYNRPAGSLPPLGPYELSIAGNAPQLRVTDETVPVSFLAPEHRVLTTPNKIGPADFTGWVQERGAYFPSSWNERYEPILAMSDPGEPPLKGSVLVARHGKGYYVYTGLAFFRQLPAGVPGAYRLFANLVSLGK
jgi:LmbE family N-acetylglucosaminyl deacetylase